MKFIISNTSIQGTIPPEIGNVSTLQQFHFEETKISGTIPPEIGRLNNLDQFLGEGCSLTGTIPSELGQLSELSYLSLSSNTISGTIPLSFAKLSKLVFLHLTGNNLSGTIPPELSNMTEATYILLSNNQLEGTLPPELSGLKHLSMLSLNTNQLTGTLPPEFSRLSELGVLRVGANYLHGTIPSEYGLLKELNSLVLHGNQLNGTLPEEVAALPKLRMLMLYNNTLSGEIPLRLCQATSLAVLQLNTNQFEGTIPPCLCTNITNLKYVSFADNLLSGNIPSCVGNWKELQQLWLSENKLEGEIPEEIGMLTALSMLYLQHNLLTGQIPASIGNMTSLEMLSLHDNRLTGTLPPELNDSKALVYLWLGANDISGTIPTRLGGMGQLSEVYLSGNQLVGEIPSELCALPYLDKLLLHQNSLTGSIPSAICQAQNLTTLTLSDNKLTGTIPPCLPVSLLHLVLHRNFLNGIIPSFSLHNNLEALTLFQMELYGRLRLPMTAPNLNVLMVHSNRISCHIDANYSIADNGEGALGYGPILHQAQNLLGPGNSFFGPSVKWAATASVEFLWSEDSILEEWRKSIRFVIVGPVALLILICCTGGIASFFCFTSPRITNIQHWCSRLLLAWTIMFCPVMMVLYYYGSNLFECGKESSKITIAYLTEDSDLELYVAGMACLFAFVSSYSLILFKKKRQSVYATRLAHNHDESSLSFMSEAMQESTIPTSVVCKVTGVWCICMIPFGIFPALYAASESVPGGQNTLGLSESVLTAASVSIGLVLTIIDKVSPKLAKQVVNMFHGEIDYQAVRKDATKSVIFSIWKKKPQEDDSKEQQNLFAAFLQCDNHLMLRETRVRHYHVMRLTSLTRLVLMIFIPGVFAVFLNQECYRGWLTVWSECESPDTFNLDVIVNSPGLNKVDRIGLALEETTTSNGLTFSDVTGDLGKVLSEFSIPVTKHSDICGLPTMSEWTPGRCSRSVFETLGNLMVSKLFFKAFIAPCIGLLITTTCVGNLIQGLKNFIHGASWSTIRRREVDVSIELVHCLTLVEYCLVLGFLVPVVFPLSYMALTLRLSVLNRQIEKGDRIIHDTRPSTRYLHVSWILGCCLLMSFLFHSSQNGTTVVLFGMPLCAILAHVLEWVLPVQYSPWSWIVNNQDVEPGGNIDGPASKLSFKSFHDVENEDGALIGEMDLHAAELGDGLTLIGLSSLRDDILMVSASDIKLDKLKISDEFEGPGHAT